MWCRLRDAGKVRSKTLSERKLIEKLQVSAVITLLMLLFEGSILQPPPNRNSVQLIGVLTFRRPNFGDQSHLHSQHDNGHTWAGVIESTCPPQNREGPFYERMCAAPPFVQRRPPHGHNLLPH